MLELKVYVSRATENFRKSLLHKVFSNDPANLANMKYLQFYTLWNGTTKEGDKFVDNVDAFLNIIKQRKTLDSLLMIEQKLDMFSFE